MRRLLTELRPERRDPVLGFGSDEAPSKPRVTSTPAIVASPHVGPSNRSPGRSDEYSSGRRASATEEVSTALAQLARTDPAAHATLTWLRHSGSLVGGLGRLYESVGMALADDLQRARWRASIDARRHGAGASGRALVRNAVGAWWGAVPTELA